MKKPSVEILRLEPNNKSLSNLRQYRAGAVVKRGLQVRGEYTGGFALNVDLLIRRLTGTGRPVLHLYSGRSDIGDTRIDLECTEATENISVEEFITRPGEKMFEWVILDPPYKLVRPDILRDYADSKPLSGSALLRNRLTRFLRDRSNNVLWLDYCSPRLRGFEQEAIWLLLPINQWESVRCLTWLRRSGPEFKLRAGGTD